MIRKISALTFSFSLLVFSLIQAQTWVPVGTPGFSMGEAGHTSIAINKDGTPYVAYQDGGFKGAATVMRFNASTWDTVGHTGCSNVPVNSVSIALDSGGMPYLLYQSDKIDFMPHGELISGGTTVMRYTTTYGWKNVGATEFSDYNAMYSSLAIDRQGNPWVAYVRHWKDNDFDAKVVEYANSPWNTVGRVKFADDGAVVDLSLAIDNRGTPYVAYSDWSNGTKATVRKFDGHNWVNVGKRGCLGVSAHNTRIVLDTNGIPYVVYTDYDHKFKATVMKFLNNNWVPMGKPDFTKGSAFGNNWLAIDKNNTPYIAFEDGAHDYKATVMRYNGNTWEIVGSAGFSSGRADNISIAIDRNGTPYVIYQDEANGKRATVMKLVMP